MLRSVDRTGRIISTAEARDECRIETGFDAARARIDRACVPRGMDRPRQPAPLDRAEPCAHAASRMVREHEDPLFGCAEPVLLIVDDAEARARLIAAVSPSVRVTTTTSSSLDEFAYVEPDMII